MKRIEIEIMRSSDALNAAIDTWHIAESGKHVTPRISFGSIKDLFSAITEKRLELLRYVAEQKEVVNIRQLAQALDRDYKNVHTDVSELEKLGLIEKDVKGVLTSSTGQDNCRLAVRLTSYWTMLHIALLYFFCILVHNTCTCLHRCIQNEKR